jgi:hypothetical protein
MEQVNAHDKAAVITASISFVLGWGLTIAGFIVPPTGEVSGSVLAILGEAMIYTASVFGVTLYFKNQMVKFREDTRRYLEREESEHTSPRERYSHMEPVSDADGVGEEDDN